VPGYNLTTITSVSGSASLHLLTVAVELWQHQLSEADPTVDPALTIGAFTMTDNDNFFRRILLGESESPKKTLFEQLLGIAATPSVSAPISSRASAPPPFPSLSGFKRLVGSPNPTFPVPPPPIVPAGIKYGQVLFSEPRPFGYWLPMTAGLYVILAWDFRGKPRPFRPLYFGMSNDLSQRVSTSHEKYAEWQRCSGLIGIYVAHCAMIDSSERQRADLEETLIREFTPECNDTHNPFSGILGY
jgi:hypothetical protein